MPKPHCEHCGMETAVECWECASRLNPVIPQVIIDGLKSVKKIASVMIPNTITYADWEAAWEKHDAATMAYLENMNAKT